MKIRPGVLAIVIGLCFGLLSLTNRQLMGAHTFGVLSYDPYYYYIYEEVDGEYMGIDYECNASTNSICTITTDYLPDLLGRIPRAQAYMLFSGACYVDLNPNY